MEHEDIDGAQLAWDVVGRAGEPDPIRQAELTGEALELGPHGPLPNDRESQIPPDRLLASNDRAEGPQQCSMVLDRVEAADGADDQRMFVPDLSRGCGSGR